MSWYRSTLTSAQVATGEAQRRTKAFAEAFAAAGAPRVMALFHRDRADGGLDLYLTPDCGEFAAELLDEWMSVPCERPPTARLQFLVGHNEITYYLP
jgi:hypothetical protein